MPERPSQRIKDGHSGETKAETHNPSPKPPHDHNARMRELAHERLDQLFDDAAGGRFYGRVGIEVAFENGRPVAVRRQIEGTDK